MGRSLGASIPTRLLIKKAKNSFTIPQHCTISGNRIYIPKFKEGIKVREHRKVKGIVKSMTISFLSDG